MPGSGSRAPQPPPAAQEANSPGLGMVLPLVMAATGCRAGAAPQGKVRLA